MRSRRDRNSAWEIGVRLEEIWGDRRATRGDPGSWGKLVGKLGEIDGDMGEIKEKDGRQ